MTHKQKWEHYRDTRVGSYEYRARTRYSAVADQLFAMGLTSDHSLLDIGAGECGFGRYLHSVGWCGKYIPVDAVIDGADLENFTPPESSYAVAIEVLEHVTKPFHLLAAMLQKARHGVVITTPNCATVDVIGCDPTHVSILPADGLLVHGLNVRTFSWFGTANDTLLAWGKRAI